MTLDRVFEETFRLDRINNPPSLTEMVEYLVNIDQHYNHFVGSARDEIERKVFADHIDAKKHWYLDRITSALTAFESFDELINAPGGYQPTLRAPRQIPNHNGLYSVLADEYDRAQAKRNDPRRAHR